MTLYLASEGKANTLNGDGALAADRRRTRITPDRFTYDPMNPVPSYGGNVCCTGNAIPGTGGAFDQRKMEERPDILVYTSEPLKEGIGGERADRGDALRIVATRRIRTSR